MPCYIQSVNISLCPFMAKYKAEPGELEEGEQAHWHLREAEEGPGDPHCKDLGFGKEIGTGALR